MIFHEDPLDRVCRIVFDWMVYIERLRGLYFWYWWKKGELYLWHWLWCLWFFAWGVKLHLLRLARHGLIDIKWFLDIS